MKVILNYLFSFLKVSFILFLIPNQTCLADSYADSLKQNLDGVSDSAKIRLLSKASNHYQVSNPDTAIILAKEVLDLAQSNKDSLNELEGFVLLGRAYQNRSEFYKSTQYFYKALKLAEKWDLTNKLASYHNSLGISFYYLQDFDKAIYHIQKAAAFKLQLKQYTDYGTIVGNLAGVLHQLGRNKEAVSALQIAVTKLGGKENIGTLGNLYNTYGSIYQMGYKKLDSAEFFYRKALDLVKNEPEGIFQLTAHTNIGMVCNLQNKLNEAEYHLFEALKISKKFRRDIASISIYESLGNLYVKKQDFKKAYEYRSLQLDLKDSIFKSDKEKVVADLEAQYQNEKGKQIIQAQKLELEKSRNKTLIGVIVLISLVALVIALIAYFRFKNTLQKQVEAAKETFFSNVVHEIKSPITLIQGPIKLLQQQVKDPAILGHLFLAEKNLKRLNELVNQMLMVSKIEANQLTINETFGNFSEFVEPIIVQFEEEAKQKSQHLTSNLQLKDTYFKFDSDALHKIISNLLSNAIKYTPENGHIGIEIITESDSLLINVWDNGIGIDESDKEKVFSRFYRTKNSLKTNAKGVGIGLSLVKSLVEALDGQIDLQSSKGAGSVFSIKIPIHPDAQTSNTVASGTESTILLVEDDTEILKFNKELLESQNYRVITASNGKVALELLQNQVPDLIVTDLMMPEMNGSSLLKEVRENINTEHIPLIVLSAKSAVDQRMELLKLGAQAYLVKPFLPEELLHLVSNQLFIIKDRENKFKEKVIVKEISFEEKYKGNDPYTEKFFKIIFENIDNSEFTVEQFADLMATNRSHFQRKIKSLTGYSPSELIKLVRLDQSKEFLVLKKGNITEVAYMCGFSSQSYFTKSFTQHFGISPSQFLSEYKK